MAEINNIHYCINCKMMCYFSNIVDNKSNIKYCCNCNNSIDFTNDFSEITRKIIMEEQLNEYFKGLENDR